MAYYDTDPALNFDAQEQDMLQKAAQIKALRAMDLTTKPDQPEGFTSAVTGAKFLAPKIKTPLLSALTPLIQDTRAGYDESQLNKQRSELTDAETAAAVQQLQNFPKTQAAYFSSPDGVMHPAVEPSTSDVMAATAALNKNPVTKPLVGPALDYQLTKAPGEALTRTMAAQERQRQQDNADRTYQELHNYHQAQLGKTNLTGFQETGFSDNKGAKIYANPTGSAYSANYPLDVTTGAPTMPEEAKPPQMRLPAKPGQPITPSTGAIPFTTPAQGSAKTNPGLMPGAEPTPTAMDGPTRTKVEGIGASQAAIQDLRQRRASLPPSLAGDALPTNISKSWIAEQVDPAMAKRGQFYSDMQDFTNNKLYEASGKAINENEMVRIKATMPNAASSDATWEQWFDRTNKMLEVAANRSQALATHKNYRYDPKLGAVVDDYSKKVVPGTESPFEGRSGENYGKASAPAQAPSKGAPAGDDRMSTFQKERADTVQRMQDIDKEIENTTYNPRLIQLREEKARLPEDLKGIDREIARLQPKGTPALPKAVDTSIIKSADPARVAKARANGWSDAKIAEQLRSEAK